MEYLSHALEHTLPMIPVLFITYLILETMERKHWNPPFLSHSIFSPVLAALTGLIPQCELTAFYANLYAAKTITTGTLIASFISCSDEMLPVLVGAKMPAVEILQILLIKLMIASLFGIVLHINSKRCKIDIETLCHNENCGCESGILKSALIHTFKITSTLLIITLILEVLMHDAAHLLEHMMNSHLLIQIVLSTLIGLIPSCASSILLTQLYLSEILPFSALIAGLCANAGTGLVVLARVNPDKKDTLRILIILLLCSLVSGLVLSLI